MKKNVFTPMPTMASSKPSIINKIKMFPDYSQSSMSETTSSPSPRKKRPERQFYRTSSTSSLYIESSVVNLDIKAVIKGISIILYLQLIEDTKLKKTILPESDLYFFSEEKYIKESKEFNSKESLENISKQPTIDEIHKFIESIYNCIQFPPECCIIGLIYITRVIALTGLGIQATIWRPLVFISLMVSQKVWEDIPLSNDDYSSYYPFFDKEQLNKLEMKFLEIIQYNTFVPLSTYTFFYLNLRDLTYEDSCKKPLSIYDVEEIEYYNKNYYNKCRKRKHKRYPSTGKYVRPCDKVCFVIS